MVAAVARARVAVTGGAIRPISVLQWAGTIRAFTGFFGVRVVKRTALNLRCKARLKYDFKPLFFLPLCFTVFQCFTILFFGRSFSSLMSAALPLAFLSAKRQ